MTTRLTLLCAAAGTPLREARFGDAPPDDRGVTAARGVATVLPPSTQQLTAPSLRCRGTAEALGLQAEVEPALRDCDMGNWNGRTLADVAGTDPEGLATWTTDPAAAPHGGESVRALCRRVAGWLDRLPDDEGRLLVVAEAAVVRAAYLHALSAPPASFWRVDVPPLSVARLTGRAGRWNVRLGALPPVALDA